MELSDTMHGIPMQTGRPNGVRSSDWLAFFIFTSFESPRMSSDSALPNLMWLVAALLCKHQIQVEIYTSPKVQSLDHILHPSSRYDKATHSACDLVTLSIAYPVGCLCQH